MIELSGISSPLSKRSINSSISSSLKKGTLYCFSLIIISGLSSYNRLNSISKDILLYLDIESLLYSDFNTPKSPDGPKMTLMVGMYSSKIYLPLYFFKNGGVDITKSQLGPTILGGSAIFGCSQRKDEAVELLKRVASLYPDFTISLLNMNEIDDKIHAVDIDPDIADFKGYCISIEVPEKLY